MNDSEKRTDPGSIATMESPQPERTALFPEADRQTFRTRWDAIQVRFVDEPRDAVKQADALVAETIGRLESVFGEERGRLEQGWAQGGDVSTEELRQSLQRYRSFFDRLLSA